MKGIIIKIEKQVFGDGSEIFYLNEYKGAESVDSHGGYDTLEKAKGDISFVKRRLLRNIIISTEVVYEEKL